MEHELMITGIGGQGVQLAAQVMARAAALESRSVTFLGVYGGMMRGGSTDSTVIIADGPIESPPIASHTWSAIAMHDEFWAPVAAKLRPGALVLVNDATFHANVPRDAVVHRLRATELAAEHGNPMGGALVMIGAYATITAAVAIESLVQAMRDSIPSYRVQHVAANEAALRAGAESVADAACTAPFWREEVSA